MGDHEDSSLLQPFWRWHLVPLRKRPSLDPTQRLRLIPGMATTATATDHTDMATTATGLTDMATITERGLLMPSLLLRLLPTLRLSDPWYGYYGYGYRPYGYGYYRPYGYGYYYGKRSADAEPTAEAANPEAEADPWYGYYGYGYRPYGYGYYRPYGYGYYYGKR